MIFCQSLKYNVVSFGLLTIGFIIIIISCILYSKSSLKVDDFGIVIDAGSSHTKVSLYTWPPNKNYSTSEIKEISQCNFNVPIDRLDDNLKQNLLRCINTVKRDVTLPSLAKGIIYLGATAGLRLINISDHERSNHILDEMKTLLNATNLILGDVSIISGENEALFSWISANYLLDKFPKNENATILSSVGTLDMGGASNEIAFQTDHSSNETKSVQLFGYNYTVNTKSNLCFGVDKAKLRLIRLLIQESPDKENLTNPCLPINVTETYYGSDLSNNVCLSGEIEFFHNYTITGGSDYVACSNLITEKLLNSSYCEKYFNICMTNEHYLPPKNMKFHAISAYYYSLRALGITNQTIDRKQYLNGTRLFCDLSFDEIKHKPNLEPHHVKDYCFILAYNYYTLTNIYKFDNWHNIIFSEELNSKPLDWTLGYMIEKSNSIPFHKPLTGKDDKYFNYVSLGIFVCILACIDVVLSYRRNRVENVEVYEPIQQQA